MPGPGYEPPCRPSAPPPTSPRTARSPRGPRPAGLLRVPGARPGRTPRPALRGGALLPGGPAHAATCVVNGPRLRRSPGSPLPDLALDALREIRSGGGLHQTFFNVARNGQPAQVLHHRPAQRRGPGGRAPVREPGPGCAPAPVRHVPGPAPGAAAGPAPGGPRRGRGRPAGGRGGRGGPGGGGRPRPARQPAHQAGGHRPARPGDLRDQGRGPLRGAGSGSPGTRSTSHPPPAPQGRRA
jgi:translation initiation factor IF-2